MIKSWKILWHVETHFILEIVIATATPTEICLTDDTMCKSSKWQLWNEMEGTKIEKKNPQFFSLVFIDCNHFRIVIVIHYIYGHSILLLKYLWIAPKMISHSNWLAANGKIDILKLGVCKENWTIRDIESMSHLLIDREKRMHFH